MSKKETSKDLVSNKKAFHSFEILDTFEAGIALTGTEVKSLREHGGSLQEAYIRVKGNELWLISCSIAPWKYGSAYNHEERRERKLLMHKYEIAKMKAAAQQKGYTLVPLAMYLKKGKIKLKVAMAKGKTLGDKRHAIKEGEEKRRMARVLKKGYE